VFLLGQAADVKGDARTNLNVLKNLGLDVVEIADAEAGNCMAPMCSAPISSSMRCSGRG
jgi:hypothetical protein